MNITFKTISAFAILTLLLFSSCKEEWDEHYDRNKELPTLNLYELIKSETSLSKFAELIEVVGYDSLLTSSQTFTVWAPENNALEYVDMQDKEQVRQVVSNHIARFNHSTAESDAKVIRMINGKVYHYSSQGEISFGGSQLVQMDNLARNGVLHTICTPISYAYNLYEYISTHANTSHIHEFLSSFEEEKYTIEGYDTIVSLYNPLFQNPLYGLGYIATEDSIYSMIIPTNEAWEAAYKRISPYFNVWNSDEKVADSLKHLQTSLAIVNDLIYRGSITEPARYDSLLSTAGNAIHEPGDQFSATTLINASNGLIYLADEIRYNNVETWSKPIHVECENQVGRTTNSFTTISTRSVDENSLITGISEGRYIEVQATNTSSQPYVTFDIPNVLSGKYNIYVDFVPAIVNGESFANDSTKLSFRVSHLNTSGRNQDKNFTSDDYVTSGSRKVRMLVTEGYEFPISNYYDRLWQINRIEQNSTIEVTTKFRITTNVTSKQVNDNIFTRRFRVDKIIFEPVRDNL